MTTLAVTPRLPAVLSVARVRAGIEVRQFLRERDAVVFVLIYPVMMLVIFATVFGKSPIALPGGAGTVGFAQYFLPGMIATGAVLSSFQSLAVTIAVERDDGTLKRLRATPAPAAAYFLGKVAQVVTVTVTQIVLLLAVAHFVYGVALPTSADRWATFAWVLLLGTAAGAVCGVGFSSVPRSGRSAAAVVTPVVLVLQFISGVFFQVDQLPSWLRQVGEVFPLAWLAHGMRSVFLPDDARALEPSGSWQHGLTAVVLGAWLVAGLVLGLRTFRWRRRDDG